MEFLRMALQQWMCEHSREKDPAAWEPIGYDSHLKTINEVRRHLSEMLSSRPRVQKGVIYDPSAARMHGQAPDMTISAAVTAAPSIGTQPGSIARAAPVAEPPAPLHLEGHRERRVPLENHIHVDLPPPPSDLISASLQRRVHPEAGDDAYAAIFESPSTNNAPRHVLRPFASAHVEEATERMSPPFASETAAPAVLAFEPEGGRATQLRPQFPSVLGESTLGGGTVSGLFDDDDDGDSPSHAARAPAPVSRQSSLNPTAGGTQRTVLALDGWAAPDSVDPTRAYGLS
jgi:hypothetical protein